MFEYVRPTKHCVLVGPITAINGLLDAAGYSHEVLYNLWVGPSPIVIPARNVLFTRFTSINLAGRFFDSASQLRPLMRRNPCV